MVSPTKLTKKGKAFYCCTVAILRECASKPRMKGLATSTFISIVGLLRYFRSTKVFKIRYFRYHKIELESRDLSQTMYIMRWVRTVQLLRVSDPT